MSLTVLLLSVLLWTESSAVGEHVASEDVPVLVRRELLSGTDCHVNPVGGNTQFDNPSNVAMGMAYLDGSDPDELQQPDFGNSSDVKSDGNWAMKWCQAVFGSTSYPMSPSTADRLTAMKSMCEEKGNDEPCYFGMFRPVDDVTDDSYDESTCDRLEDHDGAFWFNPANLGNSYGSGPTGGLGGSWTGSSQPSCEWYDPGHSKYTTLNRNNFQCLEYRPDGNKYFMQNCKTARHIICYRPDTTCVVPPNPALS